MKNTLKNISEFLGYSNNDHEVITLPLSHSFGLNHVLCNLMAGASVSIEHGLLRVKACLICCQKVQLVFLVRQAYGIILDRYEKPFKEAIKTLKFIVINSSPLPIIGEQNHGINP